MSMLDNKSEITIEDSTKKRGIIRSYIKFLCSTKAASRLIFIFFMLLIVFPASKTAMSFLTFNKWQLSGYYIGAVEWGAFLFIIISWLISIGSLFWGRQYKRGLLRILAIPLILFLCGIVSGLSHLFLPSRISSWPINAVYSKSRQKYFILAYQPTMTDTCYRIFGAKLTLLNPIWTTETAENTLDYSEDGSLTEDPYLTLSGDEELLIVSRGGHFTDAVLINYMQSVTNYVIYNDENREQQWQQRTDQIKALLQKHSVKKDESIKNDSDKKPLTYVEIKTALKEYFHKFSKDITAKFADQGWKISCEVNWVDLEGIEVRVSYYVHCTNKDKRFWNSSDMKLLDDHGRLIIMKHDTCLSWSNDEEKALCERLRDVIREVANVGTQIN